MEVFIKLNGEEKWFAEGVTCAMLLLEYNNDKLLLFICVRFETCIEVPTLIHMDFHFLKKQ